MKFTPQLKGGKLRWVSESLLAGYFLISDILWDVSVSSHSHFGSKIYVSEIPDIACVAMEKSLCHAYFTTRNSTGEIWYGKMGQKKKKRCVPRQMTPYLWNIMHFWCLHLCTLLYNVFAVTFHYNERFVSIWVYNF